MQYPIFPRQGDGVPVPGFPAIRSDWDGVYMAGLHGIGLRKDWSLFRPDETIIQNGSSAAEGGVIFQVLRQRYLADSLSGFSAREGFALFGQRLKGVICLLYADYHMLLARSASILQLADHLNEMFGLSLAALSQVEEVESLFGGESGVAQYKPMERKVTVPLKKQTSQVAVLHNLLLDIHRACAPVQEIYALWNALSAMSAVGLLWPLRRRILEVVHKRRYEESTAGFGRLYDEFTRAVQTLNAGETKEIVITALHADSPKAALGRLAADLLAGGKVGDLVSHFDPAAPTREANEGISEATKEVIRQLVSKDGIFEYVQRLEDQLSEVVPVISFDSAGAYVSYLVSAESGRASTAGARDPTALQVVQMRVVAESARQQLVEGVGLLCPLWDGRSCCGYKEFFQGLLRHTVSDLTSANVWAPRGCLREGGESQGQIEGANT